MNLFQLSLPVWNRLEYLRQFPVFQELQSLLRKSYQESLENLPLLKGESLLQAQGAALWQKSLCDAFENKPAGEEASETEGGEVYEETKR